jgi:hypothetical protein
MSMKDRQCDTEPLYDDPFVSHHQIPLAFEHMLEILISSNVINANKEVHEAEWVKLFINWRVRL